jgi:hypothetical protein
MLRWWLLAIWRAAALLSRPRRFPSNQRVACPGSLYRLLQKEERKKSLRGNYFCIEASRHGPDGLYVIELVRRRMRWLRHFAAAVQQSATPARDILRCAAVAP